MVIKCDDKEMREYSPTVWEDGRGIDSYIASQPGKVSAVVCGFTLANQTGNSIKQEFWIEYSCNLSYVPPNTQLAADVYFSGEFGGGWMAMDPRPRERKVFGEIWTSRCGDKFHKLVFSVPEIVGGF